MSSSSTPGLSRFNTADDSAAQAALHEVCASGTWGSKILARRPYATIDDLFAASDAAMAELTARRPGRGDGRAPADRPPEAGRPDLLA